MEQMLPEQSECKETAIKRIGLFIFKHPPVL